MNKLFSLFLIGSIAFANVGCNEECEEWHEGDDCVEMREKFYGTYIGVYTQNGQTINGAVEIAEHSGGVEKMSVSGNTFVLTGSTTFDIPLQNVYDPQGTYSMEGNGSLSGSQLSFNATQTANGQTVILNFSGTK
jgi:hypothetical protein